MIAQRLLDQLRHRGPDDEGMERPTCDVTLVHARLAVLDLSSAGHQPMADRAPDGGPANWVVFNGEIFNYRKLQSELATTEWPCRTRCDTEVILNGYRVWGEDFVTRLRGMFAFCLIDTSRGIAFLCRDRLGIKPLYTCRTPGGGLAFASELRALLSLGPQVVSRYVSRSALESFLAQGAVQGYETLIQGVSLLRPAERLCVDLSSGKELRRKQYWQLPQPAGDSDRETAIDRLRAVGREALSLHLISDAPLGLFLSGGVDSASLVALACESGVGSVSTLTLGFRSDGFDETIASRATADYFGVDHQIVPIGGDEMLAGFSSALAAMDQPTVDGFNTYLVSRAARDAGLTVALSGLGADELFGGYASFTDVPRATTLRNWALLSSCARMAGALIPNRFGTKLAAASYRPPDLLAMYLLRRELFLSDERRALQPLPEASEPNTGIQLDLFGELRTLASDLDRYNQISFFEIQLYMRHMLLRDADAFSMAAPIEYRVPFLDHVFVEAAFRLPGRWKRSHLRPKPLLLDMIGSRLPEHVWKQPKRGFTFPWGEWLGQGGPLFDMARDAANDTDTWTGLGLDPRAVLNTWTRFAGADARISPLQPLAFVTLRDFAARYRLSAG